jgi:hypothetical protein
MRTIEETLNNIAVEVEVKIMLRGGETHTAVTWVDSPASILCIRYFSELFSYGSFLI